MTAYAPRIPPQLVTPDANTVRAGRRVRGVTQWHAMAQAGGWLLAKGSSLIVGGPPGAGAIEPGDSVTLSYFVWPHLRNFARLWCVGLMSGAANDVSNVSDGLTGTIEIPSGADAKSWTIPMGGTTFQPVLFRFVEVLDTPSDDAEPIDIVISNDSTSNNGLHIASVCCYEVPRGTIASGVVDAATCEPRRPIYESAAPASVHAAALSAAEARDDARRAKLFDFFNVGGVSLAASSYTGTGNVFVADPFVMARHLNVDSAGDPIVSGTVAVAVKAGVFDTGEVRIRPSVLGAPGQCILNFSSPTPTWQTGTIQIATEDVPNLASNAGIRGGTRDRLIIEAISTGAGSIVVYGIAVGESG